MRWVGLFSVSLLALAACTTSREAAETGGPSVVTSTSVTATTTTLPSSSTTKSDVPSTTSTTIPIGDLSLGLVPVADGFSAPVLMTHRPEEEWLFVVDQPGRIWLIDGSAVSIFLDINERVTFRGEQGLLGVAFHPEQPELFYVNYIDGNGHTVVAEFHNSADRTVADPGSERVVLTVDQPASNHNGGMMAFGPDGNLWIGMGDGGAANDSFGNGQRGDTLLGSMLRIVVGSDVTPYGIPAGNVFEAAEVWSIGMRNPWRFAFDGDELWIADVGQGAVEEIDRVSVSASGLNFGWPIYEGSTCFGAESACTGNGFVFPVSEYTHGEGCSITGGYVYRGSQIPSLDGHYFFSDFCSGFLRSVAPDGSVLDWTDQMGTVRALGFGLDSSGELYVGAADGTVYRLVNG